MSDGEVHFVDDGCPGNHREDAPDPHTIEAHTPAPLTVERLRAVLREIPAIDWTAPDDLTRYATAVLAGLEAGA